MIKKLVIVALSAVFIFAGCGDKGSSGSTSSTGKKKIAIVPKAYDVDFWKVVHGGVAKAASEHGDYKIVWRPPSTDGDRRSQIETIQNLTVGKYDAISIAPIDENDLVKSVENAKKAGVKMLLWDSGLKKEDSVETFIATDNYNGGYKCASAMNSALGGKGTVIMLRYVEGSASTTKRENGFLDGLKKDAPGINYLELNQRGGKDVSSAKTAAENILTANSGKIQGIFCPNQTTTEGVLLALKQLKLTGKVKVVGFDFNSAIAKSITNGELYATAAQDPFNMGYLAVKKAVAVLEGERIDKRIDTGVHIINKENMNSEEMKGILFPDYNKWIEGHK